MNVRFGKIILFSIVCLFFTGSFCHDKKKTFECEDVIGCVSLEPGAPLKIGVIQALSGDVAPLGHEQLRGMELALDALGGEILGHHVDILAVDSGCTGEGGANAVLRLIADPQTIGIFGSTCSGAARTASHAMSEAGLIMISGNNSAPFLTSLNDMKAPDWHEGYFRVAKNEEFSGRAAALFAFENLGVTRVAAINDGDIYTQGLTRGFIRAFAQMGGQVVLDTTVGRGEKQMAPVLAAVAHSGAQMLFLPLFQPEANLLVLGARSNSILKDLVLMGSGALIERSFIESVGDTAKGMYFVGPSKPEGPQCEMLAGRYARMFKTFPSTNYYLYGYDAVNLMAWAVAKAAVTDSDGNLHIGRKALRDTLYSMSPVQGVTGPLKCNEFGDCSVPDFSILKLEEPLKGVEGLQSNVVARFTFK